MIVDEQVSDIAFLDTLAARNLIYDVVFEQDATKETLARYSIVIAAPAVTLRSGWRRFEQVTSAELAASSPATMSAPDSVVMNVNGQSRSSQLLVHLLNYADVPVFDVELKVNGRFTSAQLLSPDIGSSALPVYEEGQVTRIRVPELQTYDLLVLRPAEQ